MSLGYGLVVPFPAYGFAALVSNNEDLNSLNSEQDSTKPPDFRVFERF